MKGRHSSLLDIQRLVTRARTGDPQAVGRLISLVESASPQVREVMEQVSALAGGAHIVGITGSPGVGKSTFTNALVGVLRQQRKRVGVLAVDPSSPLSGGALLGDRVRMQDHALDPEVYIRSMATRGRLGGLSWAAPQALRVLEVAGCDVILVETVGIGQNEVDIASIADSTLILLAPGMGDGIQAAKAGVLEVGDVYVVNKADHVGIDQFHRDLRSTLTLSNRSNDAWRRPVVRAVAITGEGVLDVANELDKHLTTMRTTGELQRRRQQRAREEIEAIAVASLRARWGGANATPGLDELAAKVAAGAIDPFKAADGLLDSLTASTTLQN